MVEPVGAGYGYPSKDNRQGWGALGRGSSHHPQGGRDQPSKALGRGYGPGSHGTEGIPFGEQDHWGCGHPPKEERNG